MRLHTETSYKIQIYHDTAGWVFVYDGGYYIQVSNIVAAKKERNKAESFYRCKARIIKVTYREKIFKEKVKS